MEMETSMNYAEIVKAFIVENFLFREDEPLKENTSFLESGIVDSTGILELVAFIEETFGIRMADDELIPENLDSLSNIENYLRRKTAT